VLEKLAHIVCSNQVHHIVPLSTPPIRPEKKVCGSLTACVRGRQGGWAGLAKKAGSALTNCGFILH
jgi:hypothetical protein